MRSFGLALVRSTTFDGGQQRVILSVGLPIYEHVCVRVGIRVTEC